MKKIALILLLVATTAMTVSACGKKKPSKMFALIETDKGNIKLELFFKETPMTVANFVALAEGTMKNTAKEMGVPFYDGLKFHRVITKGNGDAQDFMVQGGDPKGTGAGDPGYKFADEFVDTLNFDKTMLLAMANSGPNTNGSQFFITVAKTTWLNQKHTIFGKVIEGQDVVNNIKQGDVMNKVTIIRQGKEAKNFNAVKIFETIQKEAKIKAEAKAKAEKNKLVDFIKENYPNATKTASGIYYVHTKEGTGKSPNASNTVEVHYEGKFLNGKVFDSSIKRGESISFPLNGVIKGWTEGLQLMKEGGKTTLIIPYKLAYGERGRSSIPPKSDLIFDIELIKVK